MATKIKIPSAAEMEKRAAAYHEAGRVRALALANLDSARAAIIKADKALRRRPVSPREALRNAADVPVCAALCDAEDAFRRAVIELAASSKTYQMAFTRFVLAPETPAERTHSLRARAA
ncbi:hypothetical protein ACVIGB_006600 [Bradyrhizobium sp. USDA 4341]